MPKVNKLLFYTDIMEKGWYKTHAHTHTQILTKQFTSYQISQIRFEIVRKIRSVCYILCECMFIMLHDIFMQKHTETHNKDPKQQKKVFQN